MKVLLDECLDVRLKTHLTSVDASTVGELGWSGKKNGELLALASGRFDVFVTADQNLQYQQNLLAYRIAVVVLLVRQNTLERLLRLQPELQRRLPTIQPGELVWIEEPTV